jgi:hypothetical protein
MALLLQASYLEELTGQESELFPYSILELSEARAKALLGFLAAETKIKSFYMFQQSKMLELDEPFTAISKIEYRYDAGDFTELVFADEEYKVLADRKLIVLTAPISEDGEVKITYTVGWTSATLPAIVKFFISLIAIDTLNKFKPGTINTSTIDTTKIGDYMVKYHVSGSVSDMSFDDIINQLALLIKQGNSEPTTSI